MNIEGVVYPLLMHTLTSDGLDSIEESLDCISIILNHGSEGQVSKNMWKIFPQLIFVLCGDEN
jgi:hypothetical protein